MTLLPADAVHRSSSSRRDESPWRLLKHLCVCGTLALFLFGVVNAFFFYSSFIPDESQMYELHSASGGVVNATRKPAASCDASKGRWIPDSTPPLYTNETCNLIQGHQNCMRNGRPDRGFLHWAWKPDACSLPAFDPALFLTLMTNKKIVFLGDSIARNHMQSLLCSLSQIEAPRNLYRDPDDKDLRWLFPSSNTTVSIFWTPYLVKHVKELDSETKQTKMIHLYLDTLEEVWKSSLAEYDVAIVSTGPWFFKGSVYYLNNTVIGCHHCAPAGLNLTQVGFTEAYRVALESVFRGMASHPGYTGLTILRTFAVEHFEGGEWWNGGYCNRSEPYQNRTLELPWMTREMHRIQLEVFSQAASRRSSNASKLRLVDVTYSNFMRPDGHPGKYRSLKPEKIQDCLHWCLPGPIDMWNQIVLKLLLEEQQQQQQQKKKKKR